MTEELIKRQADYVAEYRRLRWCAKAADTIKAQAAEIKELQAMLIEAIERVEAGDLDRLMCCDGRMCGCQGSTNADHFLHFARAALGETK